MIRKRIATGAVVALLVVSLNVGMASAHVAVKPAEVGVAAFQVFTTGVPNEKDVEVTKIRLVLPDGLSEVSPNVKAGWTIDETKTGTGEDAKVTEITWSGGIIPVGQRDDFAFSAQAPAKPTTLQWKAYQTYADGSVVSWDQKPTGSDDSEGAKGPYSETKVVDDLAKATTTAAPAKPASNARTNVAIVLSAVALVFSLSAYISRTPAKKK